MKILRVFKKEYCTVKKKVFWTFKFKVVTGKFGVGLEKKKFSVTYFTNASKAVEIG